MLVGPIKNANANVDMRVVRGVRSVPAGASEQLLPDFYCEHTTLAMNRERRKQVLTFWQLGIARNHIVRTCSMEYDVTEKIYLFSYWNYRPNSCTHVT